LNYSCGPSTVNKKTGRSRSVQRIHISMHSMRHLHLPSHPFPANCWQQTARCSKICFARCTIIYNLIMPSFWALAALLNAIPFVVNLQSTSVIKTIKLFSFCRPFSEITQCQLNTSNSRLMPLSCCFEFPKIIRKMNARDNAIKLIRSVSRIWTF
jgi:hypothetical protein